MATTEEKASVGSNRFSSLKPTEAIHEVTANLTKTSIPATSVGQALARLRPNINKRLYQGIPVKKICTNGRVVSRILTIGRGNFILFLTRSKVPGSNKSSSDSSFSFDSIAQKVRGSPRIAVSSFKRGVRGEFGTEHTPRHIDIADITYVQLGCVGTQKLERSSPPTSLSSRSVKSSESDIDVDAIVSIVHTDQNTLDLLIPNARDRSEFIEAIHQIRSTYHAAKLHVAREELLLRYIWYDIDADHSGNIDEKEMGKILDRLNLYRKKLNTRKQYNDFVRKIQGDAKSGLALPDCVAFLREIKLVACGRSQTMEDEIWERTFGKTDTVTEEEFLNKFMHSTQKESDTDQDNANSIFTHLATMEISGSLGLGSEEAQGKVDKLQFAEYLHSNLNSCFNPDHLEFNEYSMHKPFSHYWINTSHNTYLSGDQLQSHSSVEMYSRSLQRGCRCLELDVWDYDSRIPCIYHGYTLTSKILFEDVIKCVNCFVLDCPDTFPIILSLENHCSAPCQEVMANVLSEVLGDKLYVPDSSELGGDLPSPHSLRGKVIVKGKRPKELDDVDEAGEAEPVESSTAGNDVAKGDEKKKVHVPKVIPELARLTLFHGAKFKTFDESIELPSSHMHSISEPKISKILEKDKEHVMKWRQYSRGHMTRTYPAGARVDSSNYNPVLAWSMGCQLVALNFQTADAPLIINDGRFQENGNCGYVLKPDLSLSDDTSPSAGRLSLKVRVLSGSCLPKPRAKATGECIDPYVKVTLHDVVFFAEDIESSTLTRSSGRNAFVRSQTEKTEVIQDNGYCPIWNGPFFEFNVHSPEVAMMQFTLMEKDEVTKDEIIAEAAIPAKSVRPGYRSIQLFDRNNTRSGPYDFATLLVEVEVTE